MKVFGKTKRVSKSQVSSSLHIAVWTFSLAAVTPRVVTAPQMEVG